MADPFFPFLQQKKPRTERPRGTWQSAPLSVSISVLMLCFLTLIIGAAHHARKIAHQSVCRGRMSQIAMALQNYHDFYGTFPPACLTDAAGRPMHSWRVLILPFLNSYDLYQEYRFDEPWDSLHNRKLALRSRNEIWHCPSGSHDDSPNTDYVVIRGEDTLFPVSRSVSLTEIQDGPANTILLAEIGHSNIHWMEPRDLSSEEMSFRVNDFKRPSISSSETDGPAVVFADGITACRLDSTLRPETLKALTTIAKGESISKDRLVLPNRPSPHSLGE